MSDDVLLQGGCVLTLGTRTSNHARADVLIEDGVVTEIGTGLRSRRAEVIDASHAIVMPGFVDTHRRCWPSLFKNEGAVTTSPDGIDPSPDDVYAGTLLSLIGSLDAGITTVVDWYDGPATDDHVDAAMRAHADAGLRTVLVLAIGSWRDVGNRRGRAPSPSTSLALGWSLDAAEDEATARAWSDARTAGMRIHTMADPAARGRFAELGRRGLLGTDVTVVHCTGLSDGDLAAIADSDTGVALTPASDMTVGPGAPPLQALLDRGVRPGLGIDDERMGPGDILAQMRSAISIQHATYFDLKLAGKGGLPNLLSTRDVIKYGTSDGARAIGLDTVTGSIEVGKAADLIVLRTDRPNIHPVNDPIGAVVWGMDTSNLDWVFTGGRARMRDGVLDEEAETARRLGEGARERLGHRGVVTGMPGGLP